MSWYSNVTTNLNHGPKCGRLYFEPGILLNLKLATTPLTLLSQNAPSCGLLEKWPIALDRPWNLFIHFKAGQRHRPPFSDAQHGSLTSSVTKNAKWSQTILVPPTCIKVCTQFRHATLMRQAHASWSCGMHGTTSCVVRLDQSPLLTLRAVQHKVAKAPNMTASSFLCLAYGIPRQERFAIQ